MGVQMQDDPRDGAPGKDDAAPPDRSAQGDAPRPLAPGLYLVATPIGNARDITLRALDVLGSAEVLAAEDTRTLRHLMSIHGVPMRGRRIIAHHDHNARQSGGVILQHLRDGRSVAFASDAGTPLVADPGYSVLRDAAAQGLPVHAIPGASALLAALGVAGLPTDRFLFAGFVPAAQGARRRWLAEITAVAATVVMFDSPRRVGQTLEALAEIDPARPAVICRELTKKFEEVLRGTVAELREQVPAEGLRGEVVIVLAPPQIQAVDDEVLRSALGGLLDRLSVRDAAAEVAEHYGVPRKQVYALAIEMGRADRG